MCPCCHTSAYSLIQIVLQKISDRLLHLLFCFLSWHLHSDRILICGDISVNKGTGNGNFINFGLFSGMIGMTISFYATHAIVFVSCPRQFLHWWYSRPILITVLIACRVVGTWCDFFFVCIQPPFVSTWVRIILCKQEWRSTIVQCTMWMWFECHSSSVFPHVLATIMINILFP